MTLKLQETFSCAHFYKVPNWSPQQNRDTFGLCFNEHGHGHDYILEVDFEFHHKSDEELQRFETEKRKALKALRQTLDHQHLNFAIADFQKQIPTTENLAQYCWEKLKIVNPVALRLFETQNLWVEIQLQKRS